MSSVIIDVETIPAQPEEEAKAAIAESIKPPSTMSKPETIEQWHKGEGKYKGVKDALIEEAYRKTALDGAKGEIISVSIGDMSGSIKTVSRDMEAPEVKILDNAFRVISAFCTGDIHTSRPYFIGHNVQFDLKFLLHRAVINGISPGFKLPFGGRHKSDFYCTMQAWAGFGQRISQDNLCKALGLEGKPDDISGANVWDHVKAGDVDRVAEYNAYDVDTVREIYKKLNFIK